MNTTNQKPTLTFKNTIVAPHGVDSLTHMRLIKLGYYGELHRPKILNMGLLEHRWTLSPLNLYSIIDAYRLYDMTWMSTMKTKLNDLHITEF